MDDLHFTNEVFVSDVFCNPNLTNETTMEDKEGCQQSTSMNELPVGGVLVDDDEFIPENVNDQENECNDFDGSESFMEEGSDGTMYWRSDVPIEIKPKLGHYFSNHVLAEKFYKAYAEESGFDVRLSNKKMNRNGRITTRYFYCSKQGDPKPKVFDSLAFASGSRKRRNVTVKHSGCNACMKVHYVKERDRYEVYKFIEWHNHTLLNDDQMRFSRSSRELSYVEQKTVFHSCTQKLGITKGHRIRNALNSGLLKKGGTVRDYQNYRRDMNTFVGIKDAQMLIDTMTSRQEICPDYFYEYKIQDKELYAIFWADETAKLNYREFGDVISFDATFRTNRHAMSFVPFVAVDNHKKSVVVGAALIAGESEHYYEWILRAFLKAHGRPPVFVITDQCLSMKKAIPIVFPDSRHRLCMWHIMKKVDDKISVYLKLKTNFRSELNKLIWDLNMEPSVFESRWVSLMERYDLVGDTWFEEMFNIRESWILAYFKDVPMSGLMKATSRSESINAFFNVFHAFHNNLQVFLISFDNAIDTQRKIHAADEVKMKSTEPRMLTHSMMKVNAALVYSRTIFFDFQDELCHDVFSSVWGGDDEVDGKKIYKILEEMDEGSDDTAFKVIRDLSLGTIDCECNLFVRNGILCRHALKVLVNEKQQTIPEKYVIRRWRRDLIPVEWLPAKVRYGEVDAETEKLLANAQSLYEMIVEKVRNDKESLSEFVNNLDKWNSEIEVDVTEQSNKQRKNATIQEFLGVNDVQNIEVLPPSGVRNKGCGTGKRLIGVSEKVAKKMKKKKRVCRKCGQPARHDSRNCPDG